MFVSVRDLTVEFAGGLGRPIRAVNGLSFDIERGKALAIVGESGSGKSAATLAMLGLHGRRTRIGGEIHIGDSQIVGASQRQLRGLRGRRMAMIFQDPLTAMHPYHTVGQQISEAWRTHNPGSRTDARRRTLELLDRVGLPDPLRNFSSYPHQLSGGMRQRAMIAMALSCNPELLIADEPTTALDVTVQAQILWLLKDLQRDFGTTIILITHDLGVVAEIADEVVVMYAGRAVESSPVRQMFEEPAHPYTLGLLASMPRLESTAERLTAIPGSPPSPTQQASGCPFQPRCSKAHLVPGDLCRNLVPTPRLVAAGHSARCHLGSGASSPLLAQTPAHSEVRP